MGQNHLIAWIIGFFLDQLFGDPHWLPHPIRWIGAVIQRVEKRCYYRENPIRQKDETRRGGILVGIVLFVTIVSAGAILFCSYWLHPVVGIGIEAIMTYYILAAKSLRTESMRVYRCLKQSTLEEARQAVSMIVGRDTNALTEVGVAKAAIETVAENASDGVIAPMLYSALGGPVLGFFYKAVNTMDSMIGYKNERYRYFGKVAAKLDDVLNYIPSRMSAWLMIAVAACFWKPYSAKNAVRIYLRDRRNHASPNSAQTEAACAGALGIQLAGDASYFGIVVKKPTIGDATREVEVEDICRANHLMYGMAYLCFLICAGGLYWFAG